MNELTADDIARLLTDLLTGRDEDDGFYLGLIDAVTVAADGTATVRLKEDAALFEGSLFGGFGQDLIFNPG